jgi:hypothetical protein
MTNHLRFSFMALAAAAVVAYSAPARANQSDELTYLTFSAPVELPGVALPAGTYIFKHVDDDAGGRVVQVLSRDGQRSYGMFLTVAEDRPVTSDTPTVVLKSTGKGSPEAVEAWFYPGRSIGDEFQYPKAQADRIAQASHHQAK